MTQKVYTTDPSPIEHDLREVLWKTLHKDIRLTGQVRVNAGGCTFHLDLATIGGKVSVAFECDGKEFHKDWTRDLCRDALILETKQVAAIYRFRGGDIFYRPYDCLFYIWMFDPWVFSRNGIRNLTLLASDGIRGQFDSRYSTCRSQAIEEFSKLVIEHKGMSDGADAPKATDDVVSLMRRRSLENPRDPIHGVLRIPGRSSFNKTMEMYRRDPGGCCSPRYQRCELCGESLAMMGFMFCPKCEPHFIRTIG